MTDAALRRDGVIDARQDRYAIEGRKALAEHMADYIAHCRRAGQAPRHVVQKERHLARLWEGSATYPVSRVPASSDSTQSKLSASSGPKNSESLSISSAAAGRRNTSRPLCFKLSAKLG